MGLAAALPRPVGRTDMRCQWVARLLANPRLDGNAVMRPFAEKTIPHAGAAGGTVVLISDRSKVSTRHSMTTPRMRVGERASPLAWRVRASRGSIGFTERRELIPGVAARLPRDTQLRWRATASQPAPDPSRGTPDLVAFAVSWAGTGDCSWSRILLVFQDGGETTPAACFAAGQRVLGAVELTGRRVATNIANVHEAGHPESWIIALPDAPFTHRAFDHGLRQGFEVEFSDFESCGFDPQGSRIPHPNRLARLLLVPALALHWAASTGMWETGHHLPPK